MAGAYRGGAPYGNQLKYLPPRLAAYIRLGWTCLSVENTLAYYNIVKITVAKKFYSTGPMCQYNKNIMNI